MGKNKYKKYKKNNTNTIKTRKKTLHKSRKQSKTKKKFIKLNCSAGENSNAFTCYDGKTLRKLKKQWNARHPDVPIRHKGKREIWNALKENTSKVCNTERCWLSQGFSDPKLSNELNNYTFAPNSPLSWSKNPNEWLSSVDIQNVMQQYENKHKDFIFLGPSPIDFDKYINGQNCVWNELCNFDLQNIKENKQRNIGIIFNTDPHYASGSHWISLFVDLKKNFIFYFDSTGEEPPKEVDFLIKRIMKQGNNIGINLTYIENKKPHQRSNSECGMYCLHMIINLLENKLTPEHFLKHRFSDNKMESLRNEYFNIVNNDTKTI